MIKSMNVIFHEEVHGKLKNKCRFYNISMHKVINSLILEFIETHNLDALVGLPEDVKEEFDAACNESNKNN